MVVVIGDKFGEKKMVVMEPDMQHRMPWYDRYEASSGNFLAKEDLKYLVLSCYQRRYLDQGGRTWQAFGGGKNGHETFRQARIYNFRDKCVVFARNLKFSNLTQ